MIHPENGRSALLELNGFVVSGCLTFTLSYHPEFHGEQTARAIMSNYHRYLQTLIQHCQNLKTQKFTPSDFNLANLNQNDLDALFRD